MRRLLYLVLVAASALTTGCVVSPYPYPPPASTPANFDRSWDAALGAAADAGVQVTQADRTNGHITGTKAGAAVTIDLRPQPDHSLQVIFNAPASKESNPTLADRWTAAYNRRMGR